VLVPVHPQEDSTLLLSSSNDRTVTLWDINRQQQPQGQGQGSKKGAPGCPGGGRPQGGAPVGVPLAHPGRVRDAPGPGPRGHGIQGPLRGRPAGAPVGALELQRHLQGHHEGAVRGVHFRMPLTRAPAPPLQEID